MPRLPRLGGCGGGKRPRREGCYPASERRGARASSSEEESDGEDGAPAEATLEQVRQIDLSIATRIAGFGGLQTRDVRGNLSPEVWTQHSDRKQIGQLLDAESIKSMLVDSIRQQLTAEQALIKEVPAETVVDFIIRYKKIWEEQYRKDLDVDYDIAQRILSVMEDTVQEVWPALERSAVPPDAVRRRILAADEYALPPDEALVRFYFRNPYTSALFCRAAGKLLQKKEVCNKAGGYSAKQQRDDITQERDDALLALQDMLEAPGDSRMAKCAALVRSEAFEDWVADHKKKREALSETVAALTGL